MEDYALETFQTRGQKQAVPAPQSSRLISSPSPIGTSVSNPMAPLRYVASAPGRFRVTCLPSLLQFLLTERRK
jgi:hypothetical protein